MIDLNKQAEEDGNFDLNVSADTLGDKSRSQWK